MSRKPKDQFATSFGELLKDVDVSEPKPPAKEPVVRRPKKAAPERAPVRPSDSLRGDDRIAFQDAMSGVRPLDRTPSKRVARAPRDPAVARAEDDARARLAALVGGGVSFTVERDDELVRGRRAGTPVALPRELGRRGVSVEATIDLHGESAAEAVRNLVRFVRTQHRSGHRRICVVHGKGLHSEGGIGVLGDRAVHSLSEGGAAPLVLAFASAHRELGGAGALIVQLIS